MSAPDLDNERGAPSAYQELISVLESLPILVHEKRRRDRLSLRSAGEASSVGFNTLSRLERGEHCSLENVLHILRWIAEPATVGSQP